MKIKELTSNVAITEKNENQYVHTCPTCWTNFTARYIRDPSGIFSDKVIPDIDGFTDEPVVRCDVRVVKNTFIDDSK